MLMNLRPIPDRLVGTIIINAKEEVQTIENASGTVNWDVNEGGMLKITLTGDVILNINNASAGASYVLIAQQDEVGGHSITYPTNFKLAVGHEISTNANAINIISILYDGTYFYGIVVKCY